MSIERFRELFGHSDQFRIEKAKAKRQMRSMKLRGTALRGSWLAYVKPPVVNSSIPSFNIGESR